MGRQLALETYDLSEEQVQASFDWALRQGNRTWLWPDIDVREWQAALARIAAVTRQVLTEGRARHSLTGDAEAIGIAGFTSGMGPLLGHWIQMGSIDADDDVAAVLALHLRHNTARMERMAERAVAAVEHLAGRGVRVTVLKGMHTAYSSFPTPGTRPLSDVDLLVAPADKQLAGQALRELGFLPGRIVSMPPEQEWRLSGSSAIQRSLSLVHSDSPWYIDLHTSLNRRHSLAAPVIELDALLRPDTVEPWPLSPKAQVLAPFCMALHLAFHASCGLESLTLLRLTELVFVIRNATARKRFSWEEFLDASERVGALASVYPALVMSEQLAPGTVPSKVLQASAGRAPVRVRKVMERLRPESAQRVLRCSLEERFMWSTSPLNRVRQIILESLLVKTAPRDWIAICRLRLWRLLRGTVSFRAPEGF